MPEKSSIYAQIDKFNLAMEELSKQVAQPMPMKAIIASEVTSILTATIKRTKKATTTSIINSMHKRGPWRTINRKKYNTDWRYPDAVWGKIQQKLAESLAAKLAAKGFAAQVWYRIGLRIGPVQAPPDVVAATKPHVSNEVNYLVKHDIQNGKYVLEIQNNSPLITFSDSRQAFFTSTAGRIGFFRRNLANGVFKTMESTLKKYPGFKATNGSP